MAGFLACLVICHDNSVVFMAVGVVVWPPKVPCEVKSRNIFFMRECHSSNDTLCSYPSRSGES